MQGLVFVAAASGFHMRIANMRLLSCMCLPDISQMSARHLANVCKTDKCLQDTSSNGSGCRLSLSMCDQSTKQTDVRGGNGCVWRRPSSPVSKILSVEELKKEGKKYQVGQKFTRPPSETPLPYFVPGVQVSSNLENPNFDSYTYLDVAHRGFGKKHTASPPSSQQATSSGSASYLDQLSSINPFDAGGGQKFSLGCRLVEKRGLEEGGATRGVMVATDVQANGTVGRAGVQEGDIILAINGLDTEKQGDVKEAMRQINSGARHDSNLTSQGTLEVQLLVQRLSVGLPEILVIPQGAHERQEEEDGEWF